MIKFKDIPFYRLDMVSYKRHFEEELERFSNAKTMEEAYDAMLDLDTLMVKYQTMATIVEIRNTMDVTDAFYKEEAAWCDKIRPEYEALESRLSSAMEKTPFKEQLSYFIGEEAFKKAGLKEQCFSEEILEDLREENRLSARYSELTATLKAKTAEGEVPLVSLAKMGSSENREERSRFYKIWEESWMGIAQELDQVYDGLVKIRAKIAGKLGKDSYTQIGYCSMGRTSYGKKEVAAFRNAVKEQLVPVVTQLFEEQRKRLGVETLYHYDEDFSFPGEKYDITDNVVEAFKKIYGSMSKETAVFYDDLTRGEFYDLAVRPGKINGAYSNLVGRYNMPFIFETYNSTFGALKTFAHETGHGFHSYLKRGEPFRFTENCSSDLAEIHSMSMEFLVWPYLNETMPEAQIDRYKYQHLKGALSFIPYGCAVDEFQETVYDHPEMTPNQRLDLWKKLEHEYMPFRHYDNQSFLSEGRFWQRQTHIYKWPFYYIDYVLAQTCAMQVHFLCEENREKGWNCYMDILRYSGKYGFTDTLHKAGLQVPFEDGVIRTLSEKAIAQMEQLSARIQGGGSGE